MSDENTTSVEQPAPAAVRSSDGLEHPVNDLRLRRDLSAEKSEPVQNRETPHCRELEIKLVKSCITKTDSEIQRVEGVLAQMRQKQIARTREVAIQETLARCSNDRAMPQEERRQ